MQVGDKLLPGFILCWLLFNWATAASLPLDADEAYYWMYSRQLAWGYFDHPPLIALLIRIGTGIVSGELGVRLLMPLLSCGALLLLWDLLGRPRKQGDLILLLLLFAAMPLLQIYAFVATPDAPLLFFSALFLRIFQRFIERPGWRWAVGMGVVMAALLYSKYHGILLIGLVTLSQIKLLRQPYFYVAAGLGSLLFLPHLYWQYLHDFPSFRYHLSGRNDPYELKHTLNYLFNQVLIFSPLLFLLIVRSLWRQAVQTPLERALRWVIYGFWLFFLYTTFKGHVEPQWTVVLSLAFIIILYREGGEKPALRRWIVRLAGASTALLVVARIFLIWPGADWRSPFQHPDWIPELAQHCQPLPVVFQNSYRRAALYEFYTQTPAYTFTDMEYRDNQYDIWDRETALHDQRVWMIGHTTWEGDQTREVEWGGTRFHIRQVDSLQITQKVTLQVSLSNRYWSAGDTIAFTGSLFNPYEHDIRPYHGDLPVSIVVIFGQKYIYQNSSRVRLTNPSPVWPARTRLPLQGRFVVPDTLAVGKYQLRPGLRLGYLPPAYAGPALDIGIEK